MRPNEDEIIEYLDRLNSLKRARFLRALKKVYSSGSHRLCYSNSQYSNSNRISFAKKLRGLGFQVMATDNWETKLNIKPLFEMDRLKVIAALEAD